jgi:A/G-specific adenine glycosylase
MKPMRNADIPLLRRRLLAWYGRHKRDFPWRRNPTLYRTLVSEFMLQQTRADQALPYYRRFLREFPSLRSLAAAPLDRVLKLWEGLGYYRRAEQLHRTAHILASRSQPTLADLRTAPGIGPYTWAAIGSIIYGEPLPVVDGNARRVMSRMLALGVPPDSAAGDREIRYSLETWISRRAPGNWNQAIMELGASICVPRNPRCERCPLCRWCRAHGQGTVDLYPLKRPARNRPHRHIAAAIIRRRDGRILIAQRPAGGLLPNLWEFPGGKQEKGESLKACCLREIAEELDITISVGDRVARIPHAYSHYSITLHVFDCRHESGRPKTLGCQKWRWVRAGDLRRYPFPRANWPVIDILTRST